MSIPKICFLGSSYIGAVYSAYKLGALGDEFYDIDFYGHSNGGFPNVDIVNNQIINVRFKSRASPQPKTGISARIKRLLGEKPIKTRGVNAYDAFVIYADLPSPQDAQRAFTAARKAQCSAQVCNRVIIDLVKGAHAYRIAETLQSLTGKPTVLLSANVVSTTILKMDDARFNEIQAVMQEALGDHDYVPFPRALFDDLHRPLGDFYRGSVLLTGEKAVENAAHDYHHMNEKGGREVLDAVLRHLDLKFGLQSQEA